MLQTIERPATRSAHSLITPTTHTPPLKWRLKQRWKLFTNGSYIIPTVARLARRFGVGVIYSELYGRVLHADGSVTNYGLLGRNLITTAGVAFLADDFGAGGSEVSNMKYHGYGTGTNAENASNTTLQTELTTEYVSNSTRPTGSQSDSTNTYTTVGTLSPDSGGTLAITEHGIFSADSSGTLWDRTVFSAVNLVAGSDSLQTTYVATFPSGG